MADTLAKSNNFVFVKIAYQCLDIPTVLVYGEHFHFNRRIPFESQVEMSRMEIVQKEGALEKASEGFGKVELSPLQAVMIGSAISEQQNHDEPLHSR